MQKLKIILNYSGSALVAAVAFAAVFSIIAVGTLRLTFHGSDMLKRDTKVIKTYWANESGIRVALRYISRLDNPGAVNVSDFDFQTGTSSLTVNGYTPIVSCATTFPSVGMPSYSLTSESDIENKIKNQTDCHGIMIATIQKYTFFGRFTNRNAWVGATVDGNYHTNGYLYVSPSMEPPAHVTGYATAAERLYPNNEFDYPDYPDPYKLGVRIRGRNEEPTDGWLGIRFPFYEFTQPIDISPLEPDFSKFDGDTINHTNDVAIHLKNNKFDVHKKSGSNWNPYLTDQYISNVTNNVLVVNTDAVVWGTLEGRLTIVTNKNNDIIIGGNTVYNNTDLSSSNDVLGLVSGNNVVIPNDNSLLSLTNHNFANSDTYIYGSVFGMGAGMSGGVYNGNIIIKNMNQNLRDCYIYGSALFAELPSTHRPGRSGIVMHYIQDERFIKNTAVAPSIPFIRKIDTELSSSSVIIYMNNLAPGTWENKLKKQI